MDKQTAINVNGWFLGVLALIFITLKLCGVIDWAWAWVLAPLWGGCACIIAVLAIIAGAAGIAVWIGKRYGV